MVQLTVPQSGEAGAAVLAAARSAGFGTIIHSVFADGGIATRGEGSRRLARAFALNPTGVVLVSMLSAGHRAATLAAADAAVDMAAAD